MPASTSGGGRLGEFFKSNTLKLTLSYLLIIMAMSISFSWVFYQTSSHELGRQRPPHSYYKGSLIDQDGDRVDFFEERIDEGRTALRNKLILLNMLTLLVGTLVSYLLARYSLEPIENALTAQDRFVSDASHELRTPLTVMLTTNEIALRKPKLTTNEAKDLIKSNNEEINKLNILTDGLLRLARNDYIPINLKNVNPDEIISDAISKTEKIANAKKIKIVFTESAGGVNVKADKDMIMQLLVILLDNAIKFSPENSEIEIIKRKKGNELSIGIKDQGPGIAKAEHEKVFDRFYRVDTSRNKNHNDGYGIGLAIAKQIAHSNGGKIELKSQPGKGAEFNVYLTIA